LLADEYDRLAGPYQSAALTALTAPSIAAACASSLSPIAAQTAAAERSSSGSPLGISIPSTASSATYPPRPAGIDTWSATA